MEELSKRIVIDPDILVGKPVIKGTRIPVYLIIELLGNGISEKEILRQYPTLKKDDIKASLLYASKCLDREVTVTLQKSAEHLTHILLDENMPENAEEWLNKKGFKTTSVSKTNLKGARDEAIAKYAQKHKMTILTMDTDFAQIYYHTLPKDTFTVIVVKAKPATPNNIIELLSVVHQKINLNEIQNKLVIITKKRIRIIS